MSTFNSKCDWIIICRRTFSKCRKYFPWNELQTALFTTCLHIWQNIWDIYTHNKDIGIVSPLSTTFIKQSLLHVAKLFWQPALSSQWLSGPGGDNVWNHPPWMKTIEVDRHLLFSSRTNAVHSLLLVRHSGFKNTFQAQESFSPHSPHCWSLSVNHASQFSYLLPYELCTLQMGHSCCQTVLPTGE